MPETTDNSLEETSPEPPPAISPVMSLWDIVAVLVASDDGRLQLTDEDNLTITTMIKNKVDNCVDFHATIESEIERHESFAKKHHDHAVSLKKKLGRFESYIKNVMISGQFEKLPGEQFQISLSNPPGSLEIVGEPNQEIFENLEEFVTLSVKYTWNKAAIKKAIADGTYPLTNAQIVKNRKPKFDIKKGIK